MTPPGRDSFQFEGVGAAVEEAWSYLLRGEDFFYELLGYFSLTRHT